MIGDKVLQASWIRQATVDANERLAQSNAEAAERQGLLRLKYKEMQARVDKIQDGIDALKREQGIV